jgi:hypothetical protein
VHKIKIEGSIDMLAEDAGDSNFDFFLKKIMKHQTLKIKPVVELHYS